MREFQPRLSRWQAAQKAEAEARRKKIGITEEQEKAMNADFERRIGSFRDKWRVCRLGRCRRGRQCHGSPVLCSDYFKPWTHREYRRLRRDIVRKPPRVQGALSPQPTNRAEAARRPGKTRG